jgi:hypothetical protein
MPVTKMGDSACFDYMTESSWPCPHSCPALQNGLQCIREASDYGCSASLTQSNFSDTDGGFSCKHQAMRKSITMATAALSLALLSATVGPSYAAPHWNKSVSAERPTPTAGASPHASATAPSAGTTSPDDTTSEHARSSTSRCPATST